MQTKSRGDILIFLTGREEIERCLEEFSEILPTYVDFPPCISHFNHTSFRRRSHDNLKIYPLALHAGIPIEEQMRVFEPTENGARKVIVATNIAEVRSLASNGLIQSWILNLLKASITIEGIKFVIDCGFVKVLLFLRRKRSEGLISLLWVDPDIQPKYKSCYLGNCTHISRVCRAACWKSWQDIVWCML